MKILLGFGGPTDLFFFNIADCKLPYSAGGVCEPLGAWIA